MITQQELGKLAKALYGLQLEHGFDDRVDHFFDFLAECGYTVSKPGSAAEEDRLNPFLDGSSGGSTGPK